MCVCVCLHLSADIDTELLERDDKTNFSLVPSLCVDFCPSHFSVLHVFPSSFHSLPLALHKSHRVLYLMNTGAAPPALTVGVYHDCKTFKNTVSCSYRLLWRYGD